MESVVKVDIKQRQDLLVTVLKLQKPHNPQRRKPKNSQVVCSSVEYTKL